MGSTLASAVSPFSSTHSGGVGSAAAEEEDKEEGTNDELLLQLGPLLLDGIDGSEGIELLDSDEDGMCDELELLGGGGGGDGELELDGGVTDDELELELELELAISLPFSLYNPLDHRLTLPGCTQITREELSSNRV